MSLPAGTRLGPYEILDPIGSGGMGEVYRARDTRLGREVAVKVLPEELAQSAERRERFAREAQAVAALSHPNILALHDVGQEGATHYAVTELLEGETLRHRLGSGPLPLRKAIDFAVQTARGLAAAHERGIVHRDLKPENLFVTREGRLAILDFGLARQTSPPGPADDTRSPTLAPPTDPGTVMGTVGYMSPEQVRGGRVDPRTDIFSLGAVLYEMLSGRRAFQRGTSAEIMTAILREDPPALEQEHDTTGAHVPPGIERIVTRCLEKRPEERFQSARDLGFALEAASAGSTSSRPVEAALPRRTPAWRRALPLLWLGSGAVAGALAMHILAAPPAAEPPRVRPLTFSGSDIEPAASPDGRLVAFASSRDGVSRIWIKQLQGGGEAPLTAGPDRRPRFSPDGSSVLFVRSGQGGESAYRIGLVGGAPRRVAEDVIEADWLPDGERIALVRTNDGEGIVNSVFVRDLASGEERRLHEVEGRSLFNLRVAPDGGELAVIQGSIIGNSQYELLSIDVANGRTRALTEPGFMLACLAWLRGDDQFLLARSGSVIGDSAGVPGRVFVLDGATKRERSLFWVNGLFPLSGSNRRFGRCDVLGPGRLVYDAIDSRITLSEVPLLAGGDAARPLTAGSSRDRQPAYSPDGKQVVFSSNRSGNLDLWVVELDTGALRQLTDDPAQDWDPGFTPDGQHLVWSSDRSGRLEIWIAEADGTGARQLSRDGVTAENPTATADGRWIVYASGHPDHTGIWRIHPDGTDASLLAPGRNLVPEVSPDGRHVLFAANAGVTRRDLTVADIETGELLPFRVEVDWTPAASSQVLWGRARWMPDGRRIVFVGLDAEGRSGVYVQDFAPDRDTIASRHAVAGFSSGHLTESLGVSPDGRRLTIATLEQTSGLALAEGLTGVEPPSRVGRVP